MTQLFINFCKYAEKNLQNIKTMSKNIVCGMVYIDDCLCILRDDEDYKAYDILFGKWEDYVQIPRSK